MRFKVNFTVVRQQTASLKVRIRKKALTVAFAVLALLRSLASLVTGHCVSLLPSPVRSERKAFVPLSPFFYC